MQPFREKIRKAKAQLERSLAAKVKNISKYFYKYINSKRKPRQNLHPLLDDAEGNMVTKDQDKAEVLNAFCMITNVQIAEWRGSDGITHVS